MKRLAAAAFATIMLLGCASCSEDTDNSNNKLIQSVTEIENPSISHTTESSSDDSRIIYRERIYNTDSYTKSDFFIESDGRVWCGFYMHNEGSIDELNRLWTKDGKYSENYQLDDDEWLAAVLSETKDDDFMLFGEIYDFESMSGEKLSALSENIAAVDTSSECDVQINENVTGTEKEYVFTDMVIGGEICRCYVNTEGYVSTIQDDSANAAIEQVHAMPEYEQWRELCKKQLLPYKSE